MTLNNLKKGLSKPKFTLDRFGQLIFTFKEVSKLAARVNLKLLIWIFVLNGIWGFSSLPGFYLEKLILDKLIQSIGNPNWQTALWAVGGLVGLRLLLELGRNLMSRVIGFMRRTMSRMFHAELDALLGKKLAELDLATIEDPDFKDRFNKVERESGRRAWGLMMPLSDIPNYLVGFLSAVGLLIVLHPLVAVGILLASLPQFFIDQKFIKKGYQLRTELAPLHRLWGWISNYLVRNRSYMELKILNLSNYLSKRLKAFQNEAIGKQTALGKQRMLSRFGSYTLLAAFEFVVSLWLIVLVVIEKITIGSFQMYIRALRSAQSNLNSLVSSFLEIYENYVFVSDLVWFLNLQPKIQDNASGIKLDSQKQYPIELEKVWFRYRDDQPWILKNINLNINPGDKLAIVGENGAGKSTLIKLIARFYDPQKGKVHIGKRQLSDINLSQWRSRMAILFQTFETYPFSAKESIGYGDISRINKLTDIKEAATKTGIDEFITGLPLKWNNPLTPEFDQGIDLSIGQWQRMGISRMLFREKANILIMDEPTSNVDPEAEEKIFKQLLQRAQNKILIFVSQRFSTVRRADKIIVIDKGRLIEQGSHQQLMKLNRKYARLFKLQAKGYQN